jgi:hypothetical protein
MGILVQNHSKLPPFERKNGTFVLNRIFVDLTIQLNTRFTYILLVEVSSFNS